VNDDIEEENFQKMMNEFSMPEVTKTKARSLRLLTTEEAIMRLELSGDAFLLYRCQEDQQLKVIYKRRDQSVGILQPEGSI
jgi:putative sigma-54 modulation protein